MKINILVGDFFAANCYILTFDNFALVIDPCVSYKQIKKIIGNLELKAILLTHGHADHFSYLEDIKEHVNAKIYCHKLAKEKLEDENKNYSIMSNYHINCFFENDDYQFIHEGNIKIENIVVKVIETPGHSNCSVTFVIEDNMFTGDTLFYKTVGRTDLYSSNFLQMNESLKKLFKLKGEYKVFPGHGKSTLLCDEIMHNPYLMKLN